MDLDELIHSIDIVEYISQYVDLTQKNGEFWGISPFSFPPENTPSFSIRRENNSFFDFSSGLGGNVFSFTKAFFKCSSVEAIKKLEEYIGCDSECYHPREKLLATKLCKKYAKHKTTKETSSSVMPDNCMDKYDVIKDKLKVWADEGISYDTMNRFGVKYDQFANRLVYPIKNISGKIVNIGGRTLDPNYKEKGLRKYTYYSGWGGAMNIVYGLYDNLEYIKSKKEVILFEGCKSVLLADTWRISNCGAILTSHLSPNQMKILAKLGCRVVFALDKEIDIRNDRNINKLKQYVNVEYLFDIDNLLNDKDAPVDKGKEVFLNLYNNRKKLR